MLLAVVCERHGDEKNSENEIKMQPNIINNVTELHALTRIATILVQHSGFIRQE